MKFVYLQLKKMFNFYKTIFFIKLSKLNSKKILILKKELFKKKIFLKFFSLKMLKRFFFNVKQLKLLNLLQENILFLCSKNLNFFESYTLIFEKFQKFCFYTENKFFLFFNIKKTINLDFVKLLEKKCFDLLILFLFFFKKIFKISLLIIKNEKSI